MKRTLLSGIALLALIAVHGQDLESRENRLTEQFEKIWSNTVVYTPENVLAFAEDVSKSYDNHIASYTPVFLKIKIDEPKHKRLSLPPSQMHFYIIRHREN